MSHENFLVTVEKLLEFDKIMNFFLLPKNEIVQLSFQQKYRLGTILNNAIFYIVFRLSRYYVLLSKSIKNGLNS